MEEEKEITEKQKEKLPVKAIIAAAVLLVIIVGIVLIISGNKKEPKKEIITEASLKEIVNVSELSTYEAVYNGVAQGISDKGTLDYYVSYEAKIKAGIDFSKVEIDVDNQAKIITITIPDIEITDVNVDIASMEYIFVNNKANTATVSEAAYKACIDDVKLESSNEDAIYELAEQNAKNVVEALVKPFIGQLDAEYELVIN